MQTTVSTQSFASTGMSNKRVIPASHSQAAKFGCDSATHMSLCRLTAFSCACAVSIAHWWPAGRAARRSSACSLSTPPPPPDAAAAALPMPAPPAAAAAPPFMSPRAAPSAAAILPDPAAGRSGCTAPGRTARVVARNGFDRTLAPAAADPSSDEPADMLPDNGSFSSRDGSTRACLRLPCSMVGGVVAPLPPSGRPKGVNVKENSGAPGAAAPEPATPAGAAEPAWPAPPAAGDAVLANACWKAAGNSAAEATEPAAALFLQAVK